VCDSKQLIQGLEEK